MIFTITLQDGSKLEANYEANEAVLDFYQVQVKYARIKNFVARNSHGVVVALSGKF